MTVNINKYAQGGLASIKEACQFLSLGRTTIYGLMRSGDLDYIFIGGVRRIPRSALIEFTERALEEKRIPLSG